MSGWFEITKKANSPCDERYLLDTASDGRFYPQPAGHQ
jgi:hypothetical protein